MQLELEPLEYSALVAIVLDHFLESHQEGSDKTHEWIDVITDQVVTIDQLLDLLLNYNVVSTAKRVKQNISH